MQKNWIGKSPGAKVKFAVAGAAGAGPVEIFTTRIDTIYRASAIILAPTHPLATQLLEGSPTRSEDRKSTRLKSSHRYISYAVFCLKKKKLHVTNTMTAGMPSQHTFLSLLTTLYLRESQALLGVDIRAYTHMVSTALA